VANETLAKPIAGFFVLRFNSASTAPNNSVGDAVARCGRVSVMSRESRLAKRPGYPSLEPNSNTNSSPSACNISEEDAVGMNGDLSADIHAARDYTATIARMLTEEKFEELDCLAVHSRSTKERFPGGMWKLHELYKGVSNPVQYPVHATQEDWEALLQRLEAWVTARPKSVTARVALALAYIGYAGDARGDGSANTVSESEAIPGAHSGGQANARRGFPSSEQVPGVVRRHAGGSAERGLERSKEARSLRPSNPV
jgi:hypothetical protein